MYCYFPDRMWDLIVSVLIIAYLFTFQILDRNCLIKYPTSYFRFLMLYSDIVLKASIRNSARLCHLTFTWKPVKQ